MTWGTHHLGCFQFPSAIPRLLLWVHHSFLLVEKPPPTFVECWQWLMRVVVVVEVERDGHICHTCKCDYMLVTCMAMSECHR